MRTTRLVKSRILHTWGRWAEARGQTFEYILMLSPARSGSTLLAHILISNPEIFGMGEAKIELASARDYRTIVGKNLYYHRRHHLPRTGQERYILDKMVHNYLLNPDDMSLLNDAKVRIIFLLRDPDPLLASYMRVVNVDEKKALDYFVSRMACLTQYARGLAADKTSLFLTYEQLLACTRPVLNLLQDYLELQEPLTEQYEVTKTTGVFGLGDKSENIKSGRIIKSTAKAANHLTPETLAAAQQAYDHCTAVLHERCLHVGPEQCSDANIPPQE